VGNIFKNIYKDNIRNKDMCKILDIDALLITSLTYSERITFKQLREMCEEIMELHREYIISLDSESINLALEWYPEMIHKEDNFIVRSTNFSDYEEQYIENEFITRLPDSIGQNIHNFIAV
jgi:hypothetical protein